MWIHFGTSLYGKVDVIPGVGFVACKFFHVMYVPVVPLDTWFVLEGSEGKSEEGGQGWKGCLLASSLKAIGFGYGRAALIVGSGFLALAALPALAPSTGAAWASGFGAAACIAAVAASYRFNRAGLQRALEIAAQAGIPQERIREIYRDPANS